jgi:hypothetical protein
MLSGGTERLGLDRLDVCVVGMSFIDLALPGIPDWLVLGVVGAGQEGLRLGECVQSD